MKFSRNIALAFTSLAAAASLGACTDAQTAQWGSYGDEAHVKCYSGGTLIYDGYSTGKIGRADSGSDGYYFRDKATGRLREISGDCDVDFGGPAATTSQQATTGTQSATRNNM